MNTDRRAILSLIAMGRITPREAERLLAVWSERDEVIVRIAVIFAIAWMVAPHTHEVIAGLSHAFNTVVPRLFTAGQQVLTSVSNVFGRVL
jgi:hypothetical protein